MGGIHLSQDVVLRPDRNRSELQSKEYGMLSGGIIYDSLATSQSGINRRKNSVDPRVLLLVSPYTKRKLPLKLVKESLVREKCQKLEKDLILIQKLEKEGIFSLDEMKRAGTPMGLLRVGTATKRAGYEVKIVDGAYEGWNNEKPLFIASDGSEITRYGLSDKEIEQKIRDFDPDVVGISCDYTHEWGNARALADLVKKYSEEGGKAIPIIMGGTHPTGLPEDVLLDSPTDYIVARQADVTFVELLNFLTGSQQNNNIENIHGIVYRRNGSIITNKPRPFIKDMSLIGIPDYSLVDLSIYSGPHHSGGRRKKVGGYLAWLFTTIGCNTRCTFCAIPPVQGGWLGMNREMLDDYLHELKKTGASEVIIEDDHLLHDPDWALTVCDLLEKYKLPWFEEGGLGLFNLIALLPEVDEDFILREGGPRAKEIFWKTLESKRNKVTTEYLIRRMAESGCYSVYLAVESANEDSLETSNKPGINSNAVHTEHIVRTFAKYGINATCGLMLGFVNPVGNREFFEEKRDDIERTIRYGERLRGAGAAFINPFIFTPLPGAPHFNSLSPISLHNTDLGFSHEFPTIDYDKIGDKDSLTVAQVALLREAALIRGNGFENYILMRQTGTWPVKV